MTKLAKFVGIATIIAAAPALADVTLTLNAKGYDDFFKRCDFKVNAETSADIDTAAVHFQVPIKGLGAEICRSIPNQRSCQDADDFNYTCEDMTSVDVLNVQCTSADGAEVPCGKLSIAPSQGTKAKLVLPDLTGTNDAATKIFPILAGNDDFFNSCKVGMGVSAPEGVTLTKVDYRVMVRDQGESRCTASVSNGIGTGIGCGSAEPMEFTCADVTQVFIDSVVCEDNDGQSLDCGNASLRTSNPDMFIDSLN